eukprot:6018312-Pleurochrysis_carterae.AAC.1
MPRANKIRAHAARCGYGAARGAPYIGALRSYVDEEQAGRVLQVRHRPRDNTRARQRPLGS